MTARGFATNRVMVAWGLSTLAFVLLATLAPPLRAALKTTPLAPPDWALVVAAVVGGTAIVEWAKRGARFDSPRPAD